MTRPRVVYSTASDESSIGGELADLLAVLSIARPFVLTSQHGKTIAEQIRSETEPVSPPGVADQRWATDLGSQAHRGNADAIVAIGGGRCIDVGKLAAAHAGLALVVIPTQLSHDGICSPVAVVPDATGRSASLGAIEPRGVFISPPTLTQAPVESLMAGIGDLIANPFAVRDWELAASRGLEDVNDVARDMSLDAYESLLPYLDRSPAELAGDVTFLRTLAEALISSGLAMILAGTSRPASGGEHEISHAIDHLYGGRALHGAQVAFGSIISSTLHGNDPGDLIAVLERLSLPARPEALSLSTDDVIEVLLEAPRTRPGRFTILEATDLDADGARALVHRIWG